SAAPVASVQANGDTNAVIIVYSVTVVIPGDTPGHVEAVTIPVAESIGAFASENCAVKSEDVTGEFERRIQFLGHKGMTMQIHGDWFKNPFIFSIEATVTALEGPAGTCDDRKKIKFNVSPRAGQKGPGVIEPVSE
ncbi:MAG: hypothetical protein HYY93_07580, partial [Planctomycetes bacterium]|nr:hypothetical protein [Planctomycetota bacterium]